LLNFSIQKENAWREYEYYSHEKSWLLGGLEFERYVTKVLKLSFDDFFNPNSAGSRGDWACDGIADSGRLFFACYGQTATMNQEDKTIRKFKHDFLRAVELWPDFEIYYFVTNGMVAGEFGNLLSRMQRRYDGFDGERKITIKYFGKDDLWELIQRLSDEKRQSLFPGTPHFATIELADLVPILEVLQEQQFEISATPEVKKVSSAKMDFNKLPKCSRSEFNSGRRYANTIGDYFSNVSDIELEDKCAAAFRSKYLVHKALIEDPYEVLERLYTDLGGSDFRYNVKKAVAVFAVVAYFFDSCYIFEEPPLAWQTMLELSPKND
jgi:hypothetical protein